MDLAPSPASASSTANPITSIETQSAGFTVQTSDVGKVFLCDGTFDITLSSASTYGSTFYFFVYNYSGKQSFLPAVGETFGKNNNIVSNPGHMTMVICSGGSIGNDEWYQLGYEPYFIITNSYPGISTVLDGYTLPVANTLLGAMDKMTIGALKKEECFAVNNNGVNQAVTGSTATRVNYSTKEIDTFSGFTVGTGASSSRYLPLTAGDFLVTAQANLNSIVSGATVRCHIYKNGADHKQVIQYTGNTTHDIGIGVSAIVAMNGSTDYLEHYVTHTDTNANVDGATTKTFFCAVRVST